MEELVTGWLEELDLSPLAWNLALIAASILLSVIVILLIRLYRRARKDGKFSFTHSILRHIARPLKVFLPILFFDLVVDLMKMPPKVIAFLNKGVEIALILSFAWLLVCAVKVLEAYVLYRISLDKEDNLRERKIRTQLEYLRQVATVVIVILAIAAVLLSFASMRKIGAGLLTGVGISGIIIGFAAQKSLGNLLAGFQIAFTQPLRIDDALLVENEFGNVEEITLTYVVMRLWDERRLILPINYFIEKPFQNWTRTTSDLLGSVMIYVDYSLPVEPLRAELTRLLKANTLWDGKVNAIQVTDAKEKSMEIRALMSASNSGRAFDLRCYVRENLISFINRNYPDSFPKLRNESAEGKKD